jgi:hypothetical protein
MQKHHAENAKIAKILIKNLGAPGVRCSFLASILQKHHAENAKIAKILIKNLGALSALGVMRSYAKASRRER